MSGRPTTSSKIVSVEELERAIAGLRSGGKVVFTNGCFDLLHPGHIKCLDEARARGDVLIVAVNTDDSVRRLKGLNRPVIPLEERMEAVAGLPSVSFVVPLENDTPRELIARLRPDVHVKGGDYRAEDLPETEVVRSYGGEIFIVPLVGGYSTTEFLRQGRRGPSERE